MEKSGNSAKARCIMNLLQTFKGEVPYARAKGIPPGTIDLPEDEVEQQLVEDAEMAIEKYEPRVNLEDVEIDAAQENGNYEYSVDITDSEDSTE